MEPTGWSNTLATSASFSNPSHGGQGSEGATGLSISLLTLYLRALSSSTMLETLFCEVMTTWPVCDEYHELVTHNCCIRYCNQDGTSGC